VAPKAEDFRRKLKEILDRARQQGMSHVDVRAGVLHRQVGNYPGPNHRMPVCCVVMRSMMTNGDQIMEEPPKGMGASLTVRYHFHADEQPNAKFTESLSNPSLRPRPVKADDNQNTALSSKPDKHRVPPKAGKQKLKRKRPKKAELNARATGIFAKIIRLFKKKTD
jgi:hypothetical protein